MSWGKTSEYHCKLIHGYPQAVRHFQSRGPVRSARWRINERPLVDTSEKWFKLVQESDWYDLVCYDHKIIRYCAPHKDGSYEVLLAFHQHGYRFLSRMGWTRAIPTIHGTEVFILYNTPLKGEPDPRGCVPEGWSAKLVFNVKGKLIPHMSGHLPVYTHVLSDEDKALRKETFEALDPLLDLLMLRIPTFHASSVVSTQKGRPFGGIEPLSYGEHGVFNCFKKGYSVEDILHKLIPFCQSVYNVSLSKRLYVEDYRSLPWTGASGVDFPPVDAGKFRTAMRAALIYHTRLSRKTGRKEIPQFPESLPSKYYSS